MGRRGPVPKPTVIKEASGNPGRRALNEHEPVPPKGEVTPPDWLRGKALELWNQIAPVCVTMRTLTVADVLPFARYCRYKARWIELTDKFWSGPAGTVYKPKDSGQLVEFPQSHEIKRCAQVCKELEDRFGLSPGARSRLRIERVIEMKRDDTAKNLGGPIPISEFIRGGGPQPPTPPTPARPPTRGGKRKAS